MRAHKTAATLAILCMTCHPSLEARDRLLASIGHRSCSNPAMTGLGEIARSGHRFVVYEHVWDWNSGNRQTRRLLFFRDGRYIGHYYSTGQVCQISGNSVVCIRDGEAARIPVSADAPRDRALVNGELWEFETGRWSYRFCDKR